MHNALTDIGYKTQVLAQMQARIQAAFEKKARLGNEALKACPGLVTTSQRFLF